MNVTTRDVIRKKSLKFYKISAKEIAFIYRAGALVAMTKAAMRRAFLGTMLSCLTAIWTRDGQQARISLPYLGTLILNIGHMGLQSVQFEPSESLFDAVRKAVKGQDSWVHDLIALQSQKHLRERLDLAPENEEEPFEEELDEQAA